MTLPEWVSYIPCDLTAPDYEATLARALEEGGFRRDRGAVFLWEGVTTYIGVAATDRCLRFLGSNETTGQNQTKCAQNNLLHRFN